MNQSMTKITKSRYYKEMYPPLSNDQYVLLRDDISQNGQLVPIVVNGNGTIIDGYNRYQVCKELEIEPKIKQKSFGNEDEEISFIISMNHNRRHLSTFQKVEAMMPLYDKYKEDAKKTREEDRFTKSKKTKGMELKTIIYQRISREIDSDNLQVRRAVEILQWCDSEMIDAVRDGSITIDIAYQDAMMRQAEIKKEKDASLIEGEPHTATRTWIKSGKYKMKNLPVKEEKIQCTVCRGHGRVSLEEYFENIEFDRNWYMSGTEYHYYLSEDVTLCYKRKHFSTKRDHEKIKDFKKIKKFTCRECLAIYKIARGKKLEVEIVA